MNDRIVNNNSNIPQSNGNPEGNDNNSVFIPNPFYIPEHNDNSQDDDHNSIEFNNNNEQENNGVADNSYYDINVQYEHDNVFSLSFQGRTIYFNVIIDHDNNMTISSNIKLKNGGQKLIRVSNFDTSKLKTNDNIVQRRYNILNILNSDKNKMKEFINKILATIFYKENNCMNKHDDGKGSGGGSCGAVIMNENKDIIGIDNLNEGLVMA